MAQLGTCASDSTEVLLTSDEPVLRCTPTTWVQIEPYLTRCEQDWQGANQHERTTSFPSDPKGRVN